MRKRRVAASSSSKPRKTGSTRITAQAAELNDKRSEARAPLGMASALQKIGPSDTPVSFLACTLDVSPNGARVVSSLQPQKGEHIQHLLRIPGEIEPILVNAKIVWVAPETHGGALIGLRYEGNAPSLRHRIERIVDNRYTDVRRLSFLLALGSHGDRKTGELAKLSERLGLPKSASIWETREWAKHALNLFRHKKDLSSRKSR